MHNDTYSVHKLAWCCGEPDSCVLRHSEMSILLHYLMPTARLFPLPAGQLPWLPRLPRWLPFSQGPHTSPPHRQLHLWSGFLPPRGTFSHAVNTQGFFRARTLNFATKKIVERLTLEGLGIYWVSFAIFSSIIHTVQPAFQCRPFHHLLSYFILFLKNKVVWIFLMGPCLQRIAFWETSKNLGHQLPRWAHRVQIWPCGVLTQRCPVADISAKKLKRGQGK